jgi:hypothetical protein
MFIACFPGRGEFQYKEVKIPAANMLANVGQFIPKGQLLFIATDERNKSFFDAFHSRFPRIKYLDDFMDYAELRTINPNFLGMSAKACMCVDVCKYFIVRLPACIRLNNASSLVFRGELQSLDWPWSFHCCCLILLPCCAQV